MTINFDGTSSLSLLEIITPVVQNGTANYEQTTVTQKSQQLNYSTTMYIEVNSNATEQQFNDFVTSLRAAGSVISHYQVKIIAHCAKNLSPCFNSKEFCTSSAFVGTTKLIDYVTQAQFMTALAEISSGKTQIEMNINEGISITTPESIGLTNNSNYCSQITVNADAVTGNASLLCTIKGNIFINNKMVGFIRDNIGLWHCTTDLTGEDKIKYASRCNW